MHSKPGAVFTITSHSDFKAMKKQICQKYGSNLKFDVHSTGLVFVRMYIDNIHGRDKQYSTLGMICMEHNALIFECWMYYEKLKLVSEGNAHE